MTSAAAADRDLVEAVREALRAVADPDKAPAMQAYMKSAMPFLGIPKPVRTSVLRPVWAAAGPLSRPVWEATIRELYDRATHREHRYAALALVGRRPADAWHDSALLPLLQHLAVTGAWWDLVDETAHHVGACLLADPAAVRRALLRWSRSDDLWLRRTSVIAQVGAKTRTDLHLLDAAISANSAQRNFFLRKAIGWALRDYAWTDPDWVATYVAEHDATLSPLSKREALKNIRF